MHLLEVIETKILDNQFQEVKELLENAIDTFSSESPSKRLALLSYTCLSLNDIENSSQYVNELLSDDKEVEDRYAIMIGKFVKGTIEFATGKIENASDLLTQAKELTNYSNQSNFTINIRSDILNRLATIENQFGNHDQAISLLKESLELREKLGLKQKIGATLYNLGTINFQSGNYMEAIAYLEKTQETFKEIGNNLGIAYCKMELGGIYQYQGKLQDSLRLFEQSHELFKEYGTDTQIAWSLTDLGNVHQKLGEVEKSLEFYNEATPLYQEMSDTRVIANHQRAMATSYRMMGDINKSLELNKLALSMYEEIGNKNYQGRALFQIAEDYIALQNYERALKYLNKAETIFTAEKHEDYLGRIYFQQSHLAYMRKESEKLTNYYSKISGIDNECQSPLITQLKEFVMVFLKLIEETLESMNDAKQRIATLSNQEVTDVEIHNLIHMTFIEMLIREFKLFKNFDIMDDIQEVINRLYQLAETQNSPQLLIQTCLIESKLQLILRDFDSSLELTQKALQLATDKKYNHWINHAKIMSKELQNDALKLQRLFENNDVDELLEQSGLGYFIGNLVSNNIYYKFNLDTAHGLILISKIGTSIYAKSFSNQVDFDDQLFAGFITAITSFSQETFRTSSFLEQIKLGDIQIQLLTIEGIIVCYLFSGSVLSAKYRLEQLSERIESTNFMDVIEEAINKNYSLTDNELEEILSSIFV